MITKQHWLGAIAIALSLHVLAFVSLPQIEKVNTAEDKGESGIEVDLGMLGDLGVAMVETVEENVEQHVDEEAESEPVEDEPVEEVEPEKQVKDEPIIKPLELEKKLVTEEVIKVKKQSPSAKKVNKPKTKLSPKKEVKEKPKKVAASTTSIPTKSSNTAEKKISTGSQNTVSTGGNKGAERSYIAIISAKLARYKRYPNQSRRRGQEGTATLFFVVNKDGKVTEYAITESAGYKRLDQAVIRMIKKAMPLPPFPPEMEKSQLSIRIPIEFKLNDKR